MSLYVEIKKQVGEFLLDVAFEAENEIFAVLGESGCGKSMTLKCIAGIETPDEGKIVLNGRVLFDSEKKINVPVRDRKVGYLFQNYALFPNMTVEENIRMGTRGKKEKVKEYVEAFFLTGLEKKYPHMLSGGQQQRVALARMMIAKPEIILLDEPFSAVDSYLKWKLEQQLIELIEKYRVTTLFVSHNRDEVYRLCERMGIIHRGKMQVIGTKSDIFKNPKTLSAATLIGCKNVTRIERISSVECECKAWGVKLHLRNRNIGDNIKYLGIMAHDIRITSAGDGEFEGRIERVIEAPYAYIYVVRVLTEKDTVETLRIEMPKNEQNLYKAGESVGIILPEEKLLALQE